MIEKESKGMHEGYPLGKLQVTKTWPYRQMLDIDLKIILDMQHELWRWQAGKKLYAGTKKKKDIELFPKANRAQMFPSRSAAYIALMICLRKTCPHVTLRWQIRVVTTRICVVSGIFHIQQRWTETRRDQKAATRRHVALSYCLAPDCTALRGGDGLEIMPDLRK